MCIRDRYYPKATHTESKLVKEDMPKPEECESKVSEYMYSGLSLALFRSLARNTPEGMQLSFSQQPITRVSDSTKHSKNNARKVFESLSKRPEVV
eukprot:6189673-Amphidinium_carterae.1